MKKVAAAKDPRAGIKAARLIRDEKLAGRSPRQAGADKANLALLWVYKWGWSSPSILDIISNSILYYSFNNSNISIYII